MLLIVVIFLVFEIELTGNNDGTRELVVLEYIISEKKQTCWMALSILFALAATIGIIVKNTL